MEPTIVVALIGGTFSVLAVGLGILSAGRLRRAEKEAEARAAETAKLQAERDRLDARTQRLLDDLQEENTRLRAILANREQGCTG